MNFINQTSEKGQPRGVICGPFRRAENELRVDYAELQDAAATVLSPLDLDFVDEIDGFVVADHERQKPPPEIENEHLLALQGADFVWLHAPEGYVGVSAALELGFAHALGIPVFARRVPSDIALSGIVRVVPSPAAAVGAVRDAQGEPPTRALPSLQAYYGRVASLRGYDSEGARDCMLLLTEEIGELARAVRKTSGLARHGSYETVEAEPELADVQLYLLHLANILDIDLGSAVAEKETLNAERFRAQPARQAA